VAVSGPQARSLIVNSAGGALGVVAAGLGPHATSSKSAQRDTQAV
jgi:hypothetical protein